MKKKAKEATEEKKLIHGAMWYECQMCGKRWRMWLEKGIEDKKVRRLFPEKHKPAPFTISCQCGGFAEHVDWSKDIVLGGYRPLMPHMNRFENIDGEDHGLPILRKG